MSTIITDTDTLALLIRSEVKKGISPLMEAISNAEYQNLPELCTKAAAARYLGVHVTTVDRSERFFSLIPVSRRHLPDLRVMDTPIKKLPG